MKHTNLGWSRFFKISEAGGFANQGWFAGEKIPNKKIFNRTKESKTFNNEKIFPV